MSEVILTFGAQMDKVMKLQLWINGVGKGRSEGALKSWYNSEVKVARLCPTLDPMGHIPAGSSVHRIL